MFSSNIVVVGHCSVKFESNLYLMQQGHIYVKHKDIFIDAKIKCFQYHFVYRRFFYFYTLLTVLFLYTCS